MRLQTVDPQTVDSKARVLDTGGVEYSDAIQYEENRTANRVAEEENEVDA